MALHWHIYHLLEAGTVDDARRESRVLAQLAEELRQPTYLHFAVRWETMWALLADRQEETQALIMRTYEIGKRAQAPEIDIEAAGRQLAVAWRHDGLGQFAELLEAQERENPQLGTNLPVMALAFAQAGDLDAARGVLDRIDIDDAAVRATCSGWRGMCVLSQVCVLVGDVTRARVLYALLLPHRERNVMVGMASCMGSAERFLGLLATVLGDYPSAEVHFDTAITRNAEGGLDAYFDDGPRRLRGDARGPLRPGRRAAGGPAARRDARRARARRPRSLPRLRPSVHERVRVTRTPDPLDGPGSLRVIPNGAKSAGRDIHPMNTTKRLTRSSTDKYVGGVSGGLGDHFGIDPTLVRVGWVFATLVTGGAALLAYAAMLVVVPRDDDMPVDDRLPGVPA